MDDMKYYFLEDVGVVVTEPLWNRVKSLYPKGYEKTKMLGYTMSDNKDTVFMENKTLRLFKRSRDMARSGALVWNGEFWSNSCMDDSCLYDESDFTMMEFVREVE